MIVSLSNFVMRAHSDLSVLVVPVSDRPQPTGLRKTAAAAANLNGTTKCSCDCSGTSRMCFCRVLCVVIDVCIHLLVDATEMSVTCCTDAFSCM